MEISQRCCEDVWKVSEEVNLVFIAIINIYEVNFWWIFSQFGMSSLISLIQCACQHGVDYIVFSFNSLLKDLKVIKSLISLIAKFIFIDFLCFLVNIFWKVIQNKFENFFNNLRC